MATQTLEFLSKYAPNYLEGVEQLKVELGIDFMVDPRRSLVVLMYNQIDSPKMHPIVQECRGLIINLKNLEVVCYPFNRFFNYGEAGTQSYAKEQFTYYPKVDGSLIKLYHHEDEWLIGTKSTITSDATIGEEEKLFNDLVHEAVGVSDAQQFNEMCRAVGLRQGITYMFELVSPHNRVITHYNDTRLNWLAARERDGSYVPYDSILETWNKFPALPLAPLPFTTIPEAEAYCKQLRNLNEGVVGYRNGAPVIKVKSPLYVAAHHMRTAPTLKRYLEIILLNEVDEYLAYYPADADKFTKIIDHINRKKMEMDASFEQFKDIESQKDFAAAVKSSPYSAFIFKARSNKTLPSQEFDNNDPIRKTGFILERLLADPEFHDSLKS